jgi:hypothetical protein
MTCTVMRLQTLLESLDSLGSPPLDVSFVIVVVDVVNIVVATALPAGRASPPLPFPGGTNRSLESTQHTLEHSRDMNSNIGLGPPLSCPPPGMTMTTMMEKWAMIALPLRPLPVMPMMQARMGAGAWGIAFAICPGCSQRQCCCPNCQ